MSEGEFKKRLNNLPFRKEVDPIFEDFLCKYADVKHRVFNEFEEWLDEARKDFPTWDSIIEFFKTITEATPDTFTVLVELNSRKNQWFLKWFGTAGK